MNQPSAFGHEFVSFPLPPDCDGLRLDVVLNRLAEFVPSRSFAQKLIEAGAVRVNGRIRRASWHTSLNEIIEVDVGALKPAPLHPTAQEIPLKIIFEDDDILVVDKPAGLVVHPGAGVPDGTLVNAVLAHTGGTLPSLGDPLRAGIVHRLDRDTSGVMVVAKSQVALTEISRQFATHAQLRRYRALIFGCLEKNEQVIETWHGRDPHNRLKYAVLKQDEGKIARMKVYSDKQLAGGLASAVTCELYTGRTHQIRVQLSHFKHGLLGDVLYGPSARSHDLGGAEMLRHKELWARVRELALRQMLHAQVLGLSHPVTGEKLIFSSEPPQDFQTLEKFLSDWNQANGLKNI